MKSKTEKFIRILAIILLVYLALGALYGGIMFISDPSGKKIGMTLDYLKDTPFNNYLIPGIILLAVNGILPLLIIISIIVNFRYYGLLLIAQGILLIGWLTTEIIFNSKFFMPVFHYPLYTTGLLLVVSGYLISKK